MAKRTKTELQNITQKTKDQVKRTPLKHVLFSLLLMIWSTNLSAPRQPLIKQIEDNKHKIKCQTDQIAKKNN